MVPEAGKVAGKKKGKANRSSAGLHKPFGAAHWLELPGELSGLTLTAAGRLVSSLLHRMYRICTILDLRYDHPPSSTHPHSLWTGTCAQLRLLLYRTTGEIAAIKNTCTAGTSKLLFYST